MIKAEFLERTECIACSSKQLDSLLVGLFSEGPLHVFLASDPWGESPIPFLEGKRWVYQKCRDCNQAFHRYILSPEWNDRRYEKWTDLKSIRDFEAQFRTPSRDFQMATQRTKHILRLEVLTRKIRGQESVKLLDFGCGFGDFIKLCQSFGFDAVGIDRSTQKRENCVSDVVFPSLEALFQLKGGHYHVLTLFEVLEHLEDPMGVLTSVAEVLLPGGILILETPDCEGVTGIQTREDYLKIHPLEHINGFTPQSLRSFAQRAGFSPIHKPVNHVTSHPIQVLKTEARRVIGSQKLSTQQYFRKD